MSRQALWNIACQCTRPHRVRCVFGLSRASGGDRSKSRWCKRSARHSPSDILGRVGDGSDRRYRESFRHGCINRAGVSTAISSMGNSCCTRSTLHADDPNRAASQESLDCDRPWRPHHWSLCMGGWSQRAGMVGLGRGHSTRCGGPAHLHDPRLPGRAHGGRRGRFRLDVGRSCAW